MLNCSGIKSCILTGIILSLIALITTIGNLVVIFAFHYDKKLRTTNGKIDFYFILEIIFLFVFKKIILY
jgi:uncharacterized membrane protein YphA (DoxX/SURF4 family)